MDFFLGKTLLDLTNQEKIYVSKNGKIETLSMTYLIRKGKKYSTELNSDMIHSTLTSPQPKKLSDSRQTVTTPQPKKSSISRQTLTSPQSKNLSVNRRRLTSPQPTNLSVNRQKLTSPRSKIPSLRELSNLPKSHRLPEPSKHNLDNVFNSNNNN